MKKNTYDIAVDIERRDLYIEMMNVVAYDYSELSSICNAQVDLIGSVCGAYGPVDSAEAMKSHAVLFDALRDSRVSSWFHDRRDIPVHGLEQLVMNDNGMGVAFSEHKDVDGRGPTYCEFTLVQTGRDEPHYLSVTITKGGRSVSDIIEISEIEPLPFQIRSTVKNSQARVRALLDQVATEPLAAA